MASWRVAKSLLTLRAQIDAKYPNRSKGNDGTIGDERHQATHSEHNPDQNGVVRAEDITNDPAHGVVSNDIAHALINSRDPRILYVISNGQVCSSQVSPWVWRSYSGSNPHDHHFHLSVVSDPKRYDDTSPWAAINGGVVVQPPTPPKPPTSRYRSLIGGYFSNPDTNSRHWSIRSNNPGAINGNAQWVKDFPGFVKTNVIGGGNPIAIMESPEQGVALWWTLLKRYRAAGAKTVTQVITRYGGGQDYSAYVQQIIKWAGLPGGYEVKLDGDDANLLKFAKAMFRYEAGEDLPWSDAQLLYGFSLARGSSAITQDKRGPSVSVAVGGGGVTAMLLGGMGAHWIIIVGIALAVSFGLWLWLRKS